MRALAATAGADSTYVQKAFWSSPSHQGLFVLLTTARAFSPLIK